MSRRSSGRASVVVALAPVGPGRDAAADVVRHAAAWGARDHRGRPGADRCPDRRLLPLPPDAVEDHAPPHRRAADRARLPYALARRRGHDPDRPDWVERYHSQGLRHILGVEEVG